ncbi:MAG: PEGA domain-containing protein [Spirochaetales bacterium]|nr:PEGA domain-containing protein [Spirochaetales bacterium]MCF7937349.1 PEGA domain-containing protein [Spirochaetales bacterium]
MSFRLRNWSRLFPAVLVVSWILFLAACGSMPAPDTDQDSLFILFIDAAAARAAEAESEGPGTVSGLILEEAGGERFELDTAVPAGSGKKALYLNLDAGSYTLRGQAGPPVRFDLPPGSVFLFQKKVVPGRNDPGLRDLRPEDKKWVSADCSDFIEFTSWYGRNFVGFGPFTPRYTLQETRYEYRIESTPAGANVIIDDQSWGTTPLTAELETGKHLLRLEMAGFAAVQTFIDVEGAGKLSLELEKKEAATATEREDAASGIDRYTLLVTPFGNTGEAARDNLRTVFSDGIASGLYKRENLQVLRLEAEERRQLPVHPAEPGFSLASAKGAELLVSGSYNADEKLFVHAALYDVRTGQVKTSTMYTGEAGLAMFDSIDEMTSGFLENVDRVLPAVGREVIEQEQTVSQEVVSYQKKLTIKQIAANRNSRRHSLSVFAEYGGTMDNVYNQAGEVDGGRAHFGYGPVLNYDYHLFDPLQLAAGFSVIFYEAEIDSPVAIDDLSTNDYTLFLGPKVSFPGKSIDVYLSLLAHGRYSDAFDFYDEGLASVIERGPYVAAGMSLDTGIRIYFQQRFSDVPWFMDFGMTFDPFSVQFDVGPPDDAGGSAPVDFVNWGGKMHLGFGRRL